MKARPLQLIENMYQPCEPEVATHIKLHFPGPYPTRILPIIIKGPRKGTPNWTWNGDTETPTIKPSILTSCGNSVCHSWVNDGKVQFLNDCTHSLAGQTIDLLEVD